MGTAWATLAQQLLFQVPVEWLCVQLGLVATLFKLLIKRQLLVWHEVQAIASEEPQQVTRHQMSDLRVTLDHLTHQVLAQVLALKRILRQ